jgi:hypothetical protein
VSDLTRRAFAESLAMAALAPVLGVTPRSIPRLDWSGFPAGPTSAELPISAGFPGSL